MNRLISRIALLVVLLVSVFGVVLSGGGVPAPNARAQNDSCGTWKPLEEAQAEVDARGGAPADNPGYDILSSFEMTEASNSNLEFPKTLTEVFLPDGSDLAVVDPEGAILRIDSGAVLLVVCGDSQVGVQAAGSSEPEQMGAGEYLVTAGGAIFVDGDDAYYVIGMSGEATPTANVQTLDYEVSNAIGPNANQGGGSRLSIGGGKKGIICSGGSC